MVETLDGENFVLLSAKEFVVRLPSGVLVRYLIPAGATSDGASIPQIFASFGLTHYGVYFPAAFAHDAAFRRVLQQWDSASSSWVKAKFYDLSDADAEQFANWIILALMFSLGTGHAKQTIIYDALVVAGKSAWIEDGRIS